MSEIELKWQSDSFLDKHSQHQWLLVITSSCLDFKCFCFNRVHYLMVSHKCCPGLHSLQHIGIRSNVTWDHDSCTWDNCTLHFTLWQTDHHNVSSRRWKKWIAAQRSCVWKKTHAWIMNLSIMTWAEDPPKTHAWVIHPLPAKHWTVVLSSPLPWRNCLSLATQHLQCRISSALKVAKVRFQQAALRPTLPPKVPLSKSSSVIVFSCKQKVV